MEHEIRLHPEFFGPSLREILRKRLCEEVEGTSSIRYGYIVNVSVIDSIEQGKIQDSTGHALFKIKYKAIVMKVFKNEVVDAMVTNVNKMGIFADCGPLQIFISSHLVPSDMKFEPNSTPPCYQAEDLTYKIRRDDEIRLKIVGSRSDVRFFNSSLR